MLVTPADATIKKYGLTVADWQAIADRQGRVCAICRRLPKTGRLCIDHFHVKGWKKLPSEERKTWVRGLLCWVCNHYYAGRGIDIPKALGVVTYLQAFEARRAEPQSYAA